MREKPPSVRRGGEEGEDKKEAEGKEECGRGAAQLDPASTDEGNAEDGGEKVRSTKVGKPFSVLASN